jgi:ABC-2 type transport system permease protein
MRAGINAIAAASAANAARTRRQPRRLALLFVVPAIVMAIIGLAMGGYSNPGLVVGVLDSAGTGPSRALTAAIAADQQVRIRPYTDQERMRLAVFRGRLDAGVVIPPQWHGANDLQVYLAPASVGGRVLEATIDADLSRLARGTKPLEVAVVYPGGGRGGALPLGFQYTAPANLVLFVIINGLVSALSIIELRRSGLSQRLLATPARRWELFAMLTVGPFQQMVAQAVFLILLTRLFFGVHWGDPLGVLMVTAAVIFLGVSLVLLMGTVFRTPQQPVSLGPWIGVFLGMLGGTSWPLEVVPPFMRTVGHLSPAAWAMDAYLALIFGHASARAIMPDVMVLLLFSAVLATIGTFRLRPQLSR